MDPHHPLYRACIRAEMAVERRWWMGWGLWERTWGRLGRWLDGWG